VGVLSGLVRVRDTAPAALEPAASVAASAATAVPAALASSLEPAPYAGTPTTPAL
jgi:hypothetical protein